MTIDIRTADLQRVPQSLGSILGNTARLQFGESQQRARSPATKVKSARSQNRAAAHAYDLAQWREYRLAMAPDDRARQAVEDEYAKQSAAGPDFTHYRAGSDYSEPHAHSIDREGRRAILTAFDQVRAWIWRNARKPHGQATSRAYREVLSALLAFAVKHGRVYPSLETLAKMACCSVRTVSNALAWLKTWGFLSWQRRLKRTMTRLGNVTRQTSNAYAIVLKGLSVIGAAIFARKADGNHCQPSRLHHPQPKQFDFPSSEMSGAG